MIEGNLADISLPGLLQFLAGETTKSYRIRLGKGGHQGDVFICEGELLVATFGLLEGLDALSEFLTWNQGEFTIERLPSRFKNTIKSNVRLRLDLPGSFADQCAFLSESSVGVNTEIVPSRTFGTSEWQEALHVQPLEKEDYVVLGWITDGRTMRQAMREFQFDLKRAIGILYRLLITRSVEIVRPTYLPEVPDQGDIDRLAEERLQRVVLEKKNRRGTVEFQAVDITGGEGRKIGATADDTSTSTSIPALGSQTGSPASTSSEKEPQKKPASGGNAAKSKASENGFETGPQPALKRDDVEPANTDGKNRKNTLTPAEVVRDGKEPADNDKNDNAGKLIGKMKGAVKEDAGPKADLDEEDKARASALSQALSHTDDEVKATKKSKRLSEDSPRDTRDLPAVEPDPLTTLGSTKVIEAQEAEALLAKKAAEEQEEIEIEAKKVLNVMASRALVPTNFDERRTDPLPLVSIDIERLLNSTFNLTDMGTLALGNPSLDKLVQSVLLDVERGKSLLLVLTDSNRSDSAMLATYKYCLDKGYIEHSDIVMGLTVDLLLGRLELVQYLLQRRRITGDQLRDLSAISTKQGINIEKLLVAAGYVLPNDMDRLNNEKKRFSGT
jgi:hypothetical protein